MHPMETKTASGATNTESGQTKESEPSVSDISEKVKRAKVEDPFPTASESREAPPFDLRTEMLVIGCVNRALNNLCVNADIKYGILSGLVSLCAEANGI